MSADVLRFDESNSAPFRLTYGNESQPSCHYSPRNFIVAVDLTALRGEDDIDAVCLELPTNWVSDRSTWRPVRTTDDLVEWRVSAHELPRGFAERVQVVALAGGREVARLERSVEIDVRLSSQFRPDMYVIQRPNSVEGWGVVEPKRDAFQQTYGFVPFRNRFFGGLYRSIVFLNGDGSNPGGLCTGMARAALERSLTEQDGEPTLAEVLLWHGRQLSDRALLSGALWLIFGSPKRAFEAFREDLLRDGASDRCFDIGVPRPWRSDIVSALQREGHTVVPYAIEQSSADRARVFIYDPNDPRASMEGSPSVTFVFDEDRYVYGPLGQADLRHSTVIAVRQAAYRSGRTAVLVGFASAALAGVSRLRSLTRRFRDWNATRQPLTR